MSSLRASEISDLVIDSERDNKKTPMGFIKKKNLP